MNPKIKINGIGVMTIYPNPNQQKQSKSEWLEQLIDGVAECSGMTRGEVAECVMEVAKNEKD